MSVVVARTPAEVEELRDPWNAFAWQSEQAEHAYFLAETVRPLAFLAGDAALVGSVDERRLESRLGYLTVYAPRLRILRVVGIAGDASDLARRALRDVDVVAVPALPVDSVAYRSLEPLGRPRFTPTWTRRLLVLPDSFESFLASRSRKVRAGVRYDAKKLEEALGDRLSVSTSADPSDHAALVRDLETVASTTYQRRLGAGFSPQRSEVLRVALEHGWARVFVLYDVDRPVAFWWCAVHRDAMRLNTTGYLSDYARYRPGIYLLMRVIENAISDPQLRVLDFGPGRSDYKRHFSNDGYEERNLILFAPTFRAQRARLIRTGVAAASLAARRTLDAAGGTERLKAEWRRRLRG